ncbi:MAG: hypothetical protein QOK42_2185 [Frankiaceae bacterium]|jgi:hypothetical protein|nr:hypothetical protein [Frankiaceae bacterium]MDX6275438.1 hypothetical protein [Frankiales bacterium]
MVSIEGSAPGPRGAQLRRRLADEAGMTTAEYAVGTVAACGFAGVLLKLLTSHDVLSLLMKLVAHALGLGL